MEVQVEILNAIECSNIWKLRRIFTNIATEKKKRYLNEYWIADGHYKGYTFLHLSVHSDIVVCKYLLSQGCNPNVYNLDDNTPLHLAVVQNKQSMIRLLIKYGADISIKNNENKVCHQMYNKEKQTQENIQSLIEKCIHEQKELKEIKNLPFQNSDDKEIKYICNNITDEFIIEDLLKIIVEKMKFEDTQANDIQNDDNDKENDSENIDNRAVRKQELVREWNLQFSAASMTTCQQLLLPVFEDWPIIVSVPPFVIYCLETILTASSEQLMNDIINFNKDTKTMDVLSVANTQLKNNFDDKLKTFDSILTKQNINTLSELQNITSKTWKIITIDAVFTDMIRKIIHLYHINCELYVTKQSINNNKTKHESGQYILVSCSDIVSCITVDDVFIHIATMDGKIKAYEFTISDTFHEFTLYDDEAMLHTPSFMQFVNNKHEQLVTADKNGNVCCWFLHSNHPNKRAKCIRKWKTHKGHISGFGIPPNSEFVFTIGFDGYLRVRNLGYNGNIIHSVQYSNVALTALILISKTCVFIATENGVIMEVDIRKEKVSNIYRMNEEVPIRSLCLDEENKHCYFSFGAHSIGLLDISNDGEWRFIGKFVEGFDHHQSAINTLCLRNEYLYSCSEDNSIRIWNLMFLRESLENVGKKKSKQTVTMPKCIKLADSEMLSSNNGNSDIKSTINNSQQCLLEVWCSLDVKGMYHNGVQNVYFLEKMMIGFGYQKDVIAHDIQTIDDILPQKQESITQRRKELSEYEKELENILRPSSNEDTNNKNANGKKGKKKK